MTVISGTKQLVLDGIKKHSDSIVYLYIYTRISCIGKEQSSEKMSNIGMNVEFKFPEYELQPRSSMCSEFTF